MQPTTLRVFVSSTWLDLQPERQAVEEALQRMRETKFVGMEHFGSRGETTLEASLVEVDRSYLYLGIFGGRYGSGITEAEYRRAQEHDLPSLIYIKDEASIPLDGHETDLEQARRLAARPRSSLLEALQALIPVIHTLGGAEAVAETSRAVQDVTYWWP